MNFWFSIFGCKFLNLLNDQSRLLRLRQGFWEWCVISARDFVYDQSWIEIIHTLEFTCKYFPQSLEQVIKSRLFDFFDIFEISRVKFGKFKFRFFKSCERFIMIKNFLKTMIIECFVEYKSTIMNLNNIINFPCIRSWCCESRAERILSNVSFLNIRGLRQS